MVGLLFALSGVAIFFGGGSPRVLVGFINVCSCVCCSLQLELIIYVPVVFVCQTFGSLDKSSRTIVEHPYFICEH